MEWVKVVGLGTIHVGVRGDEWRVGDKEEIVSYFEKCDKFGLLAMERRSTLSVDKREG